MAIRTAPKESTISSPRRRRHALRAAAVAAVIAVMSRGGVAVADGSSTVGSIVAGHALNGRCLKEGPTPDQLFTGQGHGIAFDGNNLWITCAGMTPWANTKSPLALATLYRVNPDTGDITGDYTIDPVNLKPYIWDGGLGSVTYDGRRNVLWALGRATTPDYHSFTHLWRIDLDKSRNVKAATLVPLPAALYQTDVLIGGYAGPSMTYDGASDSLLFAPQWDYVGDDLKPLTRMPLNGDPVTQESVPNLPTDAGDYCDVSGIASDGANIVRYDHCWYSDSKMEILSDTLPHTRGFEGGGAHGGALLDEQIACDSNSFAGADVVWARGVNVTGNALTEPNDGLYAYRLPDGSCGSGGMPPGYVQGGHPATNYDTDRKRDECGDLVYSFSVLANATPKKCKKRGAGDLFMVSDKSVLVPGQTATLVAELTGDLPAGEFVDIYSLNDGRRVAHCASVQCRAVVPWGPEQQDFVAYEGPATTKPYLDFNQLSDPESISPGWLLSAQITPNGKSFVAQLNAPVDGTGYSLEIFRVRDSALINRCDSGKECRIDTTLAATAELYIAFVMHPSDSWPGSAYYLRSALFDLPNLGNDGTGNPSQNCAGTPCMQDPVNPLDGSLHVHHVELQVPGRGVPLSFTRSFDSARSAVPGRLGFGWSDANMLSLRRVDSASVAVTQENGTPATYIDNGDGTFTAPPKTQATLSRTADGSYVFTRRHKETYTFNPYGTLISAADLHGNTTTYEYDVAGRLLVAKDAAGRALRYSYDDRGFLARVDGPRAVHIDLTHDADGNLVSVRNIDGALWKYSYDSRHSLTSETSPAGVVTGETYDDIGRVVAQQTAHGRTSFDYAAAGSVRVRRGAGDAVDLAYVQGQLQTMTKGAGTASAQTWHYTYDARTLGVASVTDPESRTTQIGYDAEGNVVRLTDAAGKSATYGYDALGDRIRQTDPVGATTRWDYDAHGLLTHVTSATNAQMSYAYNALGDLTAVTSPSGGTSRLAYDAYGNLARVERPDGAVSVLTYDELGRPVTSVDAMGHVTTYNTDAMGHVLSVTSPIGGVTTYSYDDDAKLNSVVDATGRKVTRTYDAAGDLSDVMDAARIAVHYSYDASGRPTGTTDASGAANLTTYDAAGDVVAVTDPLGRTTRYSYDRSGLLSSVAPPIGGSTTYAYDAAGRVASVTDGAGRQSSYGRDDNGRVVSVRDSAGGVTRTQLDRDGRAVAVTRADGSTETTTYDPTGHVRARVDAAGNSRSYTYDISGRRTGETDPLGRSTSTTYDQLGRAQSVTDPLGRRAAYGYDDASRLISIDYSDTTPSVRYTYDTAGRRMAMTDGDGRSTYHYDAAGRLDVASAPAGIVAYTYDSLGRLATTTSPDGRKSTRSYDAAGELVSVSDGRGSATFSYDANARLLTTTHANGVVDSAAYDQGGSLASQSVGTSTKPTALGSMTYTIDARTLATGAVTTGLGVPTESYGHDALERLTSIDGVVSGAIRYDAAGNVTSLPGVPSLAYDAAGELTTTTDDSGGKTKYTFDSAGERVAQTAPVRAASACVMCLLAASVSPALSVGGSSAVTTPNAVTVDSSSASAIRVLGSATLDVGLLYSVGGFRGTTGSTVKVSSGSTSNPFSGWASPPAGPSRGTVRVVEGSDVVLSPGTYLSLSVAGSARVTLTPGTYVVTGDVNIAGDATVTGAAASIVMACAAACDAGQALSVAGSARLTLDGGSFGPGRGIALMSGSTATPRLNFSGNSSVVVTGSIDMPAATATIDGASRVAIDGGIVVWGTASLSGTSALSVDKGPIGLPDTRFQYNAAGELTRFSSATVEASYTYTGDGLRASAITNGVRKAFVWDMMQSVPALLSDGEFDYVYGVGVSPLEQIDRGSGDVTQLSVDRIGSVRLLSDIRGLKSGTASYGPFGTIAQRSGTTSPFGFAGS